MSATTSNLWAKFGSFSSNLVYIVIAVLIEVSAVFYIRKLEFRTVFLGTSLFLTAFGIQILEIYQPPDFLRWIALWQFTTGRGVVLCFLSFVAMNGFYFTGIVSFIVSFLVLMSPLATQTFNAPVPLCDLLNNNKSSGQIDTYGSILTSTIPMLHIDTNLL